MAKNRRVSRLRDEGDSGDSVDLEYYREQLQIDRVDLDECVIKQPELFYHVSNMHVEAVAERDEAKLDLDEATAEEDEALRKEAAEAEEAAKDDDDPKAKKPKGRGRSPGGLTEPAIKARLITNPRLQELQRTYLAKKKVADSLFALKEGYSQRSYMLKELIKLILAQQQDHDSSMEGAARGVRAAAGENARERYGRERATERRGRGED